MYVYTNIYAFTLTTVRLHENFVELVGLSCSSGVRIPYGRKTGEARRLGRSPRSWTFVKAKRLHLNMSVYTNIYTFTLKYIVLNKNKKKRLSHHRELSITFTPTHMALAHYGRAMKSPSMSVTLTYIRLH